MDSTNTGCPLSLLNVKQINVHHCKGATALISNALHTAHTKNQKLIVLIQEPWINRNKIQGFDPQICNAFSLPNGTKPRSCIIATKNMSAALLPQFCDGDTTSIMINTSSEGRNEDIVLCSAYLPYDGTDSTPGKTVSDLTAFCTDSGSSLVLGCDSNAHHTLWGSSNINSRGPCRIPGNDGPWNFKQRHRTNFRDAIKKWGSWHHSYYVQLCWPYKRMARLAWRVTIGS